MGVYISGSNVMSFVGGAILASNPTSARNWYPPGVDFREVSIINGVDSVVSLVYATIQYGMDQWLTAQNRGLWIHRDGTHTLTAYLRWPSVSGGNETNRRWLMNYPGEDRADIVTGAYGLGAFAHGGDQRAGCAIRGLELRDGEGSAITFNGQDDMDEIRYLLIEHCYIHDLIKSDGDNHAGISMTGESNSDLTGGAIIRYNRIYRVLGNGGESQPFFGGRNDNSSGILNYKMPPGDYSNNDIELSGNAIFLKDGNRLDTAGGWVLNNNKAKDVARLVWLRTSAQDVGSGYPYSGNGPWINIEVSNWLGTGIGYPNTSIADAGVPFNFDGTVWAEFQSTNIRVHHNTVVCAPGTAGGNYLVNPGVTAQDVHSNAFCGHTVVMNSSYGSPTNAIIDYGVTRWNYNAYQSGLLTGATYKRSVPDGGATFSPASFAAWKTIKTDNSLSSSEFADDPDANSIEDTLANMFTNPGAGDYSQKAGGPLVAAGLGGTNIGCNVATVGITEIW